MQTATSGLQPFRNSGQPAVNPYETDRLLSEYLLFHYGSPREVLPYSFGPEEALGYPVRCVLECVDLGLAVGGRALDLGCAVGRSAFEFSKECAEVVAVDFSQRFIDAAETIRVRGKMGYWRVDEGHLRTPLEARLPEGANPERVRFERGDAMALREGLGVFDVVLMANLIDRLSDPRRCLEGLRNMVKPGGQLVITSPYTWMAEYTPEDAWLGGRECEGRPCRTLDGLREALEEAFLCVGTKDLPFLIREHARKFQWSVAQASIWRRRGG